MKKEKSPPQKPLHWGGYTTWLNGEKNGPRSWRRLLQRTGWLLMVPVTVLTLFLSLTLLKKGLEEAEPQKTVENLILPQGGVGANLLLRELNDVQATLVFSDGSYRSAFFLTADGVGATVLSERDALQERFTIFCGADSVEGKWIVLDADVGVALFCVTDMTLLSITPPVERLDPLRGETVYVAGSTLPPAYYGTIRQSIFSHRTLYNDVAYFVLGESALPNHDGALVFDGGGLVLGLAINGEDGNLWVVPYTRLVNMIPSERV